MGVMEGGMITLFTAGLPKVNNCRWPQNGQTLYFFQQTSRPSPRILF